METTRDQVLRLVRQRREATIAQIAAALDMSQAAVNSALQRAHATLGEHLSAGRGEWTSSSDATEKALVQQLISAWERSDTTALIALLRDDARMVMPPGLTWFSGRDAIAIFLRDHVFGELGTDWRLLPTAANRQPAFAMYWQEPGDTAYRAFAICVLRIDDGAIAELAHFRQPELFPSFGLPATL